MKKKDKNIELIEKYGNPEVVVEKNRENFFSKLLGIFDILDIRALWHIATHFDCAKKVFNTTDIAVIIGAIAYVIIPIDAIPDWLPFVGQLDDAGVLNYVLSRYNTKISEYRNECM